jgi:hypothetical protein
MTSNMFGNSFAGLAGLIACMLRGWGTRLSDDCTAAAAALTMATLEVLESPGAGGSSDGGEVVAQAGTSLA